jgi:hypothetical protein
MTTRQYEYEFRDDRDEIDGISFLDFIISGTFVLRSAVVKFVITEFCTTCCWSEILQSCRKEREKMWLLSAQELLEW